MSIICKSFYDGGRLFETFTLENGTITGTIRDKLIEKFTPRTEEEENGDPIFVWDCEVINIEDSITPLHPSDYLSRDKVFTTTRKLRNRFADLGEGDNLEEYDRAPAVKFWLGKSVVGNQHELFFWAGHKKLIDKVAGYYRLPVPYDDRLIGLVNDIYSNDDMRLKFLDDLGDDEGYDKPVIVGSVVIRKDKPKMIKLYEFSGI